MNFNFYEQFQNHSNEELITIVRQTDAYQPEAVAAAYQHLNERQVSENEILGIEEISESNYTGGTSEDGQEDLLVPYIQEPSTSIFANKWINILLGIIAFRFFFKAGPTLWYFFKSTLSYIYLLNYNAFLIFVVPPILFLLIFKRTKWGWLLFFSLSLMQVIEFTVTTGLALAYGYINYFYPLLIATIYPALSAFTVFILWKNDVADLFNISKSTKQKTAMIVSVLSILILLAKQ
ncbi:hypothetical protein [Pinibacter aurantiacus]|uniref:Uncharacterized protein n=1 Tax=Pinibacter aurantiacus TaxID=2851599 RepID=A0A9E2W7A4_9BACT|nr:hypothetical protein [Pinibacter aurantiacus]MBV4356281.1 hypothetical protein [Pinibacter aurantiacus]